VDFPAAGQVYTTSAPSVVNIRSGPFLEGLGDSAGRREGSDGVWTRSLGLPIRRRMRLRSWLVTLDADTKLQARAPARRIQHNCSGTRAKVLITFRKNVHAKKHRPLYLTGVGKTLLSCRENMRHKAKNVLFWVLVSFCVFLGLLVCNSMGKIIS
jgi:hypothetical protein